MMNDQPSGLAPDSKRAVIYVVFDRRGAVEDYVVYALQQMRDDADHILAVVNGALSGEGRERLEAVTDDILVRPNEGFDIWGHKAGIDHLGDQIGDYDELVLTNDTWFGPVRPYAPVFDRMASQKLDFWGMTDNVRMKNPATGEGLVPDHLQSFWIAVRKRMFLSQSWRDYWRDLPAMDDYYAAVLNHEVTFTQRFSEAGFVSEAAFPAEKYPTDHPALFNADLLIAEGCPLVKRRPFFHWPPYLDRHGVIGRWIAEDMASHGYPVEYMYSNLARNVPPKDLNVDLGLNNVLGDRDHGFDPSRPPRIVAILHIFYVDMTDELLDRVDMLPTTYDLVITTQDEGRAAEIRAIIGARPREGRSVDVRVVASNDGRDQSAFLVGCKDVLLDGAYDLVVKLHSKKTPQDGFNVGRAFKEQQFANLLASPGYAANVLALFQQEPGLGIVYPPMVHIGYPTMGRAWWANKPGFEKLAAQMGIMVPLDDISPLAPYGSMFIARPEALRLLIEQPWAYSDFGGAEAYQDGGLAHVLERVPSYAAAELGYHTRTITNADYFAASYTTLDFNFDEMSSTVPGRTYEQIAFLRGIGHVGEGKLRDFARMYMRRNHPGAGARIRAVRERIVGGIRRRLPGRR
ncbi:rhamnan synthesis F family protein [Microbacterium maritypicum]|uniref:rhamnan synthesis F family protein n=1 Tax=Microbacterium maritypicum TaxID=33918 RepID=UPI0022E55604|nr:rhamnan synthesis F family protein [Microbacterium liquefaciens]